MLKETKADYENMTKEELLWLIGAYENKTNISIVSNLNNTDGNSTMIHVKKRKRGRVKNQAKESLQDPNMPTITFDYSFLHSPCCNKNYSCLYQFPQEISSPFKTNSSFQDLTLSQLNGHYDPMLNSRLDSSSDFINNLILESNTFNEIPSKSVMIEQGQIYSDNTKNPFNDSYSPQKEELNSTALDSSLSDLPENNSRPMDNPIDKELYIEIPCYPIMESAIGEIRELENDITNQIQELERAFIKFDDSPSTDIQELERAFIKFDDTDSPSTDVNKNDSSNQEKNFDNNFPDVFPGTGNCLSASIIAQYHNQFKNGSYRLCKKRSNTFKLQQDACFLAEQVPKNMYCMSCLFVNPHPECCIFRNFRVIGSGNSFLFMDFKQSIKVLNASGESVNVTKPQIPTNVKDYCLDYILFNLKEVIEEDLLSIMNSSKSNYFFRPMNYRNRQLCDKCKSSIFCLFHMCVFCGKELCHKCFLNIHVQKTTCATKQIFHKSNHFILIIQRNLEIFNKISNQIRNYKRLKLFDPKNSETVQIESKEFMAIPKLQDFQKYWKKHFVIIIKKLNFDAHLFSPERICSLYGDQTVRVLGPNLKAPGPKNMTFNEFFQDFSQTRTKAAMKISDWPLTDSFKQLFYEMMPLKEYIFDDGAYNLMKYLPESYLVPDLGPKMYAAYSCKRNKGTTALHVDVTDAVNVLLHAENGGSATWHIFHSAHSETISRFLSPSKRVSHPIHEQLYYLHEADLESLYVKHGIIPLTIVQEVGDAVFIPAGFPHQVRNNDNCVKLAMDFVSPENVEQSLRLAEEFRHLSDTNMRKEDILGLKNLLYEIAEAIIDE
ncbi:JmjC domain-containing protein [Rozella allomycis CSF55]|uniref:JmjC domain-containing protein n=1 Tax=Rozella allomycis (strain CSF55) TaxID=988480 RepID=A0A075APY7_ROZAC|nr:JmjC domain-containing protein [Rozella allomycis CSF55]|eukprot:EPZ32291.1 JmjC domain-containing protein [Rozella allomycis CSF55]